MGSKNIRVKIPCKTRRMAYLLSLLLYLYSLSGFRLPLNILLHKEVLAVKHGIGEEGDPVAQDGHARRAAEHKVEFDVAVPKDEVIDVGVRLQVVLGIDNKVLLILAHVGRFDAVLTLQATVFCPGESEVHAPAGMYGGKEALAEFVVKQAAQPFELPVIVAQPITVSEVKRLAVEFRNKSLTVQNYPTFLLQVIAHPKVVIADEEMHLHAHVGEFGNLAQEARVALRHNKFILVPEVKHISQQIDSTRLMLDAVKEIYESALLSACMGNSTAAQVGVGEKIYGFHFF